MITTTAPFSMATTRIPCYYLMIHVGFEAGGTRFTKARVMDEPCDLKEINV